MNSGDEDREVADDGTDTVPEAEEIIDDVEAISLTPSEHQHVKDLVNGDQMNRIEGHERRYLVAGAGGETGAASRRETVYDLLDARRDPPAVAVELEDFGLTPEEIGLWTRVFDILCGMATHIVGVIEDFDGGYVWELGLLFAPSYREKTWVLKRTYDDPEMERDRYDNGMAASYLRLLSSERCHEWAGADELPDVVAEIP
ncbi:hypothetical protein OB920_15565 [Halobacteria archaeon HArc-gm2]|nr:hypothetical protein [Halobacteria archaeon HArc-gm2]